MGESLGNAFATLEVNTRMIRTTLLVTLLTCLVTLLNSLFPICCYAQLDGCSLSAWVMQQKPHSTRTIEAPPPILRDTVILVGGSSHKISIPAGFTMSIFAKIGSCRGLVCSPDGVIYATSYNGLVYALPDHNHTGTPDSTIIVAQGLGRPHGIGFYNGDLYVSNDSGALYKFSTGLNSRVTTGRTRIAKIPSLGGHFSRNFLFDTVRQKIYLQIGSNGNTDTTDIAHRAQIVEMNPNGTGYRTFARGLRNAVGMDIDPRTGALWVNNNGMDNLFGMGTVGTANNPSECVYLVCDGANYGWPWTYGFQIRNPLMMNLDTSIIRTFDGPVAEVLAHEAPLGLHFYRGNTFPAMYHNAIFQCYHGSWDRTPPAPPRITVMWADSDGHNARVTDFLNGFQPDSTSQRWSRPVSIIEGADSALYWSDDAAGYVYRIRWTGPVQHTVPETTLVIDNSNLSKPLPFNAPTGNLDLRVIWTSTNIDSVIVYFSGDSGVTWTRMGSTTKPPFQLSLHIFEITPLTYWGRVKIVDPKSGLASISSVFRLVPTDAVATANQISQISFALTSNPARDQTAATILLPIRTIVRGELFDVLGNRVETLTTETMDVGEHTIKVNIASLPAGSYILRVTVGDQVMSKLLVVEH